MMVLTMHCENDNVQLYTCISQLTLIILIVMLNIAVCKCIIETESS